MYLITDKNNNVVKAWDEELSFWDNGYPLLLPSNVAYIKERVKVNEVAEVPEEVIPQKYCYTEENGFFENPDYIPPAQTPYNISDEKYEKIKEDISAQVMVDVAAKGVTAVE